LGEQGKREELKEPKGEEIRKKGFLAKGLPRRPGGQTQGAQNGVLLFGLRGEKIRRKDLIKCQIQRTGHIAEEFSRLKPIKKGETQRNALKNLGGKGGV